MDNELKKLYREQYEMYPSLSQEEITTLYKSEGITFSSPQELINALEAQIQDIKDKINKLERDNNQEQRDIKDALEKLQALINKKEELESLIVSLNSFLTNENSIKKLLVDLNNEIEQIKLRLNEKSLSTNDEINNLRKELENLQSRKDKLEKEYDDFLHKTYISVRGFTPRLRPYPSLELRNKIVCGNLRLANYWAKVYYHKCSKEIELDELNQIAFEALISAAHYYVPNSNAKFSTYARKCIENKLQKAISKIKEKKRRPYKPKQFFVKELDRIAYIKMFLSVKPFKNFYRKFSPSISTIMHKFKKELAAFNAEKRATGETYRMFPSFKGEGKEKDFQNVINNIFKFIKESKMKILILDDDYELASLVAHEKNVPEKLREVHEFLYILDIYESRVQSIKMYLDVEAYLYTQNSSIAPDDEAVLEEINRRIKERNKKRYSYKQKGFYKGRPLRYKSFLNYRDEYLEMFNVDFLLPSDSGANWDVKSRKSEKQEIKDFYHMILEQYRELLNDILTEEDKEVCLVQETEGLNTWYRLGYSWDDGLILSKDAAVRLIQLELERLNSISDDEYLEQELKKRKQQVLNKMNPLNEQIKQDNIAMQADYEAYKEGFYYERYWDITKLNEIKGLASRLFCDDPVTFKDNYTMYETSGKDLRLSVEDEAIVNIFMEIYYKALDELPDLERAVMLAYYDETGIHSITAKEIGKKLGVSERKVYQEHQKALRRLRKNKKLQSFLLEE